MPTPAGRLYSIVKI